MPTVYKNTTPSAPIATYPRAIYRVVVERRAFYAFDYLTRFVTWPGVVLSVIENSATVAGFPISAPEKTVTNDDSVATLDYRAGSHPGAATVADLVRAVDESSKYISVKSVERLAPVPAESQGGAQALDASRDATQAAEQVTAENESVFGQLGAGLSSTVKYVAVLLAASVLLAVLIITPKGGTLEIGK